MGVELLLKAALPLAVRIAAASNAGPSSRTQCRVYCMASEYDVTESKYSVYGVKLPSKYVALGQDWVLLDLGPDSI